MAKTIKRTYFSKKLNRYVTKEYTYSSIGKGGTVVYKSGKINYNLLKKQYPDTKSYETALDIVDLYRSKSITKRLTLKSLQTRLLENNIEKLLANFSLTPEEAATQLSILAEEEIDVSYVLDGNNWVGDEFISPSGKHILLEYDYKGGILI